MITKDQALNAIARKHGHKDWELARYRLGDSHLHVLILEAMDYYAEQSGNQASGRTQQNPVAAAAVQNTYTIINHTGPAPTELL